MKVSKSKTTLLPKTEDDDEVEEGSLINRVAFQSLFQLNVFEKVEIRGQSTLVPFFFTIALTA